MLKGDENCDAKILIFAATKRSYDAMYAKLRRDVYFATVIHGDQQQ